MNFIFYLLIVIYFCLLGVKCRSVQLDGDVHPVLIEGEDNDGNHDPETNGRFSWKRLKPILRREVQRIRNVIGEAIETDDESAESTATSISGSEDAHDIDESEEDSVETNSHVMDSTSIESELINHNPDEKTNRETNVPEGLPPDKTDLEIHQLGHVSVEKDFSDNVITDILNRSSDSILLQALNDNSSEIGSLAFDETSLLSEGGHVATLQEVSTVGFELLIDSETKKNSILAEIFHSTSNLFDDNEFENSTDENGLNNATTDFTHINGSELQDFSTESELTNSDDDENKTGAAELQNENEVETEITEFHIDNETETTTELHIDNEVGNEDTDIDRDEIETENIKIGTDENAKISTGENTNVIGGSELSNSVVQDASITENRRTESKEPKCPDPGWCIFWFFALDTCAKDSHCHGSLKCCMIGCQKTCIEPEFT